MNDQASAGDGGRKRRSFIEAAELYHQIVPLPGSAAEARPNIAADDLPPLTGPQAIPDPPRSPALVVPSAPVIPQPRAQAAPEPAASIEPIPPLPPTPPSVPPAHDEIPSPAVAAPAVATLAVTAPPRRVRLWPWAALLLVAACVAAAWVERTRLVSVTHTAMPRLFASKAHRPPTFAAPAAVPAPQLASEAPPPPPVAAAISQPSPQAAAPRAAAPEPAPAAPPPPPPETSPAATPPVSAPAAPPSAPTEAAPAPAAPAPAAPAPPAPAPAAPAPATPSAAATAPDAGSQGPGPASTAAEPPAAESAPTPEPTSEPARTEPAASAPKSDAAPAPVPAVVPPPAESPASSPPAAPARKDWQVVIYYHSGSSAAEAEAARLTALLGPLTERVSMWQANAVPHLPAVVYFHPEDAAAAQDLAALLGQPASGEWHTRALPPPRTRRPPGTFEVWLPIL